MRTTAVEQSLETSCMLHISQTMDNVQHCCQCYFPPFSLGKFSSRQRCIDLFYLTDECKGINIEYMHASTWKN
jgi:hypothetical protein